MKPKCRVKVTLSCNLKCEYCINKSKEYSKKWKAIENVRDVDWQKYRTIIVSGGEPLIYRMLVPTLCVLRAKAPKDTTIYLQTNGIFLTKNFVKMVDGYIDGIGISLHNWDTFVHLKTRYVDILKIKPIRLYIQNTKENNDRYFSGDTQIKFPDVRWWSAGDFDDSEEIFVLKEQNN